MPISVVLRKEHGEEICRAAPIARQTSHWMRSHSRLINGVDPYSSTIFNARQMRYLLKEIERLLQESSLEDERASLTEISEMCKQGQFRAHRFLWLLGD